MADGGGEECALPETLASDANCSAADAAHAESTPQAGTDLHTQADRCEPRCADTGLTLDGFTLDESTLVNSPLLPYLAIVASLLEGRVIRCDELLQALLRSMRQRSFDRLPRREYVLRSLKQHPP